MKHRAPTNEELESIGAKPVPRVLDADADPECRECGGTGQITTPDRLRGGHVCPCVFRTKEAKR